MKLLHFIFPVKDILFTLDIAGASTLAEIERSKPENKVVFLGIMYPADYHLS